MEMEEKEILKELTKKFPEKILEASSPYGDETILIQKDALPKIMNFLKGKPYDYAMLLDLTCVDYLGAGEPRFEMVYHVYSLSRKSRLRIKAKLDSGDLNVDSLTSLWKNANWLEREVFDLFGVNFNGHPDMRRIFMYEGFEGHPLRKDYPLRRRQPRIRLRK